jgi:selenocysteine-specific elongation factor
VSQDQGFAVIGTAGHVDHGKTTLVRALTGVDTDRLPEEKRRGISIDLGFAALTLPSGRRAAIVDVPGHERFVKNMVAGATGIDCCLLVVAADEGVMPQTREHLDIVELLGVGRGVVALTKADMVDADWLDLIRSDLADALAGTFLADAPVVVCDAVTGRGVAELAATLDRILASAPVRSSAGRMRMPVDRVFTVPGFGTVVTGTLASGSVAVEDRLELMPSARPVRVRGLQHHGATVDRAFAGQRTAINLAGVDRDEVRRGDVVATPGAVSAARVLAARLRLLRRAESPLATGARVHLHVGTAESVARVVLLEVDELAPGESTYALLYPAEPLALASGDRFVIRRISPVTTIGGGTVLDVGRRYRRHERKGLADLALRERGDPREIVRAAAAGGLPVSAQAVAASTGLADAEDRLRQLAAAGDVVAVGDGLWQEQAAFERLRDRLAAHLTAYHRRFPLRLGMPKEELRRSLWPSLEPRASNDLLERLGAAVDGDRVAAAGWRVELPPALRAVADRLVADLEAAGIEPPAQGAALAAARVPPGDADELIRLLVETGRIVRVADDLIFARAPLDAAVARVRAHLAEHGTATMSELRDLLGTTRKYAVPLGEWMDRVHITRRQGDVRRLA